MINQVLSTTNSTQSNAFKDFKQPKNGYYINTSFYKDQNDKKEHHLGKTIAISALVVGFGTLAVFSGGL